MRMNTDFQHSLFLTLNFIAIRRTYVSTSYNVIERFESCFLFVKKCLLVSFTFDL